MTLNATSLTSWAKAIRLTLDQQGVDSKALFVAAGLELATLNDPNARYPLVNTTRLWKLAVAATNNPNLGLDVGRNINQTTFHALGYSLLASPTLKDCFERLVRYFRIVTDAGELEFSAVGAQYKFVLNPLPGEHQPADEAIDALLSVVIRLCRLLTGRRFQASAVKLRRPAPAETAIFAKVFQAPLEFGASESAIYMSGKLLSDPLPAANAELARHNDEILSRYLAHFDKQNLANRVHAALVAQLPHGEPAQERIASTLNLSLRNLQRKLSAEGTSYKEILNNTRRDLALSYIRNSRYSVSQITYQLGFSDTSSFSRAFKRWTQQAPSEYRANLLNN